MHKLQQTFQMLPHLFAAMQLLMQFPVADKLCPMNGITI
jgi:hypothetical protein